MKYVCGPSDFLSTKLNVFNSKFFSYSYQIKSVLSEVARQVVVLWKSLDSVDDFRTLHTKVHHVFDSSNWKKNSQYGRKYGEINLSF